MKSFARKFLTTATLSATATAAYANGLRVVSQDAFAAARGEAFTATADNASAIYYNPAGLTQLEGTQLRGGIYGLELLPTYEPPAGRPNSGRVYSTEKHYAAATQTFFSHSLKKVPVSVGLGLYAPYGGTLGWPDEARFRSVAQKSSLTYLRINPVVAVKLADSFSIGAGASLDYARLSLEQGILKSANPLNYFRFAGTGYAAGWNVGALWKPHEMISLGATVRGATSFNLSGQTSFAEEGVFAADRRDAKMDFDFPLSAVFGVSFRPTPKWNLEFDVDYTDWDVVGQNTIRQAEAPPFGIQQNIPVKLFWRSSWMYSVGVTRSFDNGWHLSAGYLFNENSVPDNYYTPLVADLDRHFVTIGLGRTGKNIDFDLTYQFGYGPGHTVTGSQPSSTPGFFANQNADGTYKFTSHALLFSAGLHF
jgi:long-chain fatty acid transport protein